MNNTTFTYNQESGMSAGASQFINETGAFKGKIDKCEYITSSGGALGLEFTFTSDEGMKASYLTVYYKKKDGNQNKMGIDLINAMMGCCRLQQLTMQDVTGQNGVESIAPEFTDKTIGLFLQKILRTKQDGSDTYGFDIKIPFVHQTGKTLSEQLKGTDALTIGKMSLSIKDKDERANSNQANAGGFNHQEGAPSQDALDSYGW